MIGAMLKADPPIPASLVMVALQLVIIFGGEAAGWGDGPIGILVVAVAGLYMARHLATHRWNGQPRR